ncbi:MAG: DUF1080 domain-containing protein [Planctomycetota bacterium]|nr:DUF1080 domain-containing protein [Planctomycetota bacterium]
MMILARRERRAGGRLLFGSTLFLSGVSVAALLAGACAVVPGCRSSPPPAAATGETSRADAAVPPTGAGGQSGWRPLFDGSLSGWEVVDFGGEGGVSAEDGRLVLEMGQPMTGVRTLRDFPRLDYEISLEAMRVDGYDFFCGLTFPVRDSCASLIVGGWSGSVCGISSLDGFDASENETMTIQEIENGRWYSILLRVTGRGIEAWLDGKVIVDVATAGRRIDTRLEISPCRPLGFATFVTGAALRNVRWRRIE